MTGATVAAAGATPLLYAFTLGLVAALNPCGFPLLPVYLTVFVDAGGPGGWARRTARGLRTGTCVTAGFLVVFSAAGLVVAGGTDVVVRWAPWAMIPVGALLVVLGSLAVVGRTARLPLPLLGLRGRRGPMAVVVFGIAYATASMSCALPLFLAGVVGSFGRLGVVGGLLTAVAYALGMGLFLAAVSVVAAHAGAAALRRARSVSRFVPRLAGAVVALVGAYLVYAWASYLVDPATTPGLIGAVERWPSAVSGWLAGSPQVVGAVLGTVVVTACGLLALGSRSSSGQAAAPERSAELLGPAVRRPAARIATLEEREGSAAGHGH